MIIKSEAEAVCDRCCEQYLYAPYRNDESLISLETKMRRLEFKMIDEGWLVNHYPDFSIVHICPKCIEKIKLHEP
jgi:hypothetical protein